MSIILSQKGINNLLHRKHIHHNEYEFLYVEQGEGNLTAGGKIYPLVAHTLYFIDGDEVHSVTAHDEINYIRTIINMPKPYINALVFAAADSSALEDLLKKCAIPLNPASAEQVYEILKFMNGNKNPFSFPAGILCIFSECLNYGKTLENGGDKAVGLTLKYINDNISSKISLKDIENYVFVSKSHLCRKFKKITGLTIYGYISASRISLAKKRLILSADSLSKIALDCGFGSFAYFSACFKKGVGLTPSEYRKKYKE